MAKLSSPKRQGLAQAQAAVASNAGIPKGYIPLDDIRLDPNQPRKLSLRETGELAAASDVPAYPRVALPKIEADVENVEEVTSTDDDTTKIVRLAVSILRHGIMQPISCTVFLDGDKTLFRVVSGERRVRAALLARHWVREDEAGKLSIEALGYKRKPGYDFGLIPAVIMTVDEAVRFEMQVLENELRENMSPSERGLAYKALLEHGAYRNPTHLANSLGVDDVVVQRLVDRATYVAEADELERLGVDNWDVVGRLCTQIRKGRKDVFEAFVEKWNELSEPVGGGEFKRPAPRYVWALISPTGQKKEAQTQKAPAAPARPLAPEPTLSTTRAVEGEESSGEASSHATAGSDDTWSPTDALDGRDANVDDSAFAASLGAATEPVPRGTSAEAGAQEESSQKAPVQPRRTDLDVPGFRISLETAKAILGSIGYPAGETVDEMVFMEALQSYRA